MARFVQVNPFRILSKVSSYAEPGGVGVPNTVAGITGEHPAVSDDQQRSKEESKDAAPGATVAK